MKDNFKAVMIDVVIALMLICSALSCVGLVFLEQIGLACILFAVFMFFLKLQEFMALIDFNTNLKSVLLMRWTSLMTLALLVVGVILAYSRNWESEMLIMLLFMTLTLSMLFYSLFMGYIIKRSAKRTNPTTKKLDLSRKWSASTLFIVDEKESKFH